MNPNLAFLIFAVGVAGLFFLNRDNSVRTSPALWLPVIWLWIVGSRPVSSWMGYEVMATNALDATLNGSPVDAAIFATLFVYWSYRPVSSRKENKLLPCG